MRSTYTKLDRWATELIVDPLGKEPLTLSHDRLWLISPYGKRYPIVKDVYDLRILKAEITETHREWTSGQVEYERWAQELAVRDGTQDYLAEIAGVKEVYNDIPIVGTCLDVGGHQGRLRAFMSVDHPYISCDPLMGAF